MENHIPWDRIQYYLSYPDENHDSEFEAWLKNSDDNQKLWEEINLVYLISGEVPAAFEPDRVEAWSKVENRINTPSRKLRVSPVFLRVAAALILFVLGGLSSWYFGTDHEIRYAEVYSPYGHKTKVVLPDQTVVWLNGNSMLKYETDFRKSRNVELEGEALFEVTKDPNRLFSLHSGDVKVEVYGTKFNFKHYADDSEAEVALLEGSVGLFNDDQFLTRMKPGELASLNNLTNQLKVTNENLDHVISWSSEELVIENQPFDEVLKYLERWYGVEFEKHNNIQVDQNLSFKVKTESLQELLATISYLTAVQFEINGKHVELSK